MIVDKEFVTRDERSLVVLIDVVGKDFGMVDSDGVPVRKEALCTADRDEVERLARGACEAPEIAQRHAIVFR